MTRLLSLLASTSVIWPALSLAQSAGTFVDGGNTLVSGMMLFLGNEEKVYIMDKAEGNAEQINGHPAWGAVWDINTHQAQTMDIMTNNFCASGMHLPNGSFATFGGNQAIMKGGNPAANGILDPVYQDYDGRKAIRILNPCTSAQDFTSDACKWFDNSSVLAMQSQRWYSTAEPFGNGTIVLIGGFANGGYINRNYPNGPPGAAYDPTQGSGAILTYETYPNTGMTPRTMNFLITAVGLNSYAHTFLMASGLFFLQANVTTILWDADTNVETPLPDMPNGVVRVYPASGATAMLPMTVKNNWTQTIIFCGGTDMTDDQWGNYTAPNLDTWTYPASTDCQRITPEPADGSAPTYVQDDALLDRRTMGQFITLPNGKLLVINGGTNGTAGYAFGTPNTPLGFMPYGMSLGAGPVLTPSIYDPEAPAGSRWSSAGLSAATLPRLYHSSALLLPDASVLIAGSNPNVDVNLTTYFPTTYKAEIFYPPYFASSTRPQPIGMPSTISYGGPAFQITIPPTSYSGSANDAADNTTVALTRSGFTTHAMNMGQRYMQLANTYQVNSNGSITLYVAQAQPNPNLFQPGPALLWVVINGIPSNGTMVIVGNGQVSLQPTAAVATLPPNVRLNNVSGSAPGNSSASSGSHILIIGAVIGGIVVIGVLGAIVGIFIAKRRRENARGATALGGAGAYPMTDTYKRPIPAGLGMRNSDSSSFALNHDNGSNWNASTTHLNPYQDAEVPPSPGPHQFQHNPSYSQSGMSMDYDPYSAQQAAAHTDYNQYNHEPYTAQTPYSDHQQYNRGGY